MDLPEDETVFEEPSEEDQEEGSVTEEVTEEGNVSDDEGSHSGEGEDPSAGGVWSGESSDEDDDDLQKLVETLQSFVEDASKYALCVKSTNVLSPVFTESPVHSLSSKRKPQQEAPIFPISENWEDSGRIKLCC